MSYLSRHRPICAVLQEIKDTTLNRRVLELADEAIDYAQRMSNRLMEYKRMELTTEPVASRLWFGVDQYGIVFWNYGEWPIDGCQAEYRKEEDEDV